MYALVCFLLHMVLRLIRRGFKTRRDFQHGMAPQEVMIKRSAVTSSRVCVRAKQVFSHTIDPLYALTPRRSPGPPGRKVKKNRHSSMYAAALRQAYMC